MLLENVDQHLQPYTSEEIQQPPHPEEEGNDPAGIYQCEFPKCNKRFTTKFSLKRHYYIHSRQKTFPCQFCSKVFALP